MIEGENYKTDVCTVGKSTQFQFTSNGPKGMIQKVAQFTYMFDDQYNFGFGDWNEETRKIDDERLTNNGDANIVLNTLGKIIEKFTLIQWNVAVYIKGNTAVKHRWYQMNINKHLNEIENHFWLWGQVGDKWEPYRKEKRYTAFLANRRNGGFLM